MKTTISTEATTYTYGIEGLYEYLWDGKMSHEELEEKADSIMSKVVDMINADGFTWDTTHGILEYDDNDYDTSDDAIEEFLDDKEKFIRQVIKELEAHEMALADLMREMISLGWTLDSFNEDFDNFESDEVSKDEKETARKVFESVWEDVQDEALSKTPTTCILKGGNLSETSITETVLGWFNTGDDYTEQDIENTKNAIFTWVDNHLPKYVHWVPETGELLGPVGFEFTEKEFDELLDKAYEKLLA